MRRECVLKIENKFITLLSVFHDSYYGLLPVFEDIVYSLLPVFEDVLIFLFYYRYLKTIY